MSIKVRNTIFFIFSFLTLFLVYWKSIEGGPIWDDDVFWFYDPVMVTDKYSYGFIWSKYGWPLSISIQKFLYSVFHKNFTHYHILSIILHFVNSLLVYQLGRIFNLKYNWLFFLFFMFHPTAVITTSWMIQIKTLVCFTFALTSVLAYLKGLKDWRWMIPSVFLFWCSIISKSASLPIPLVLLIFTYKKYGHKKSLWIIPFLLLSTWGVFRIIGSKATQEGINKYKINAETLRAQENPEVPKKESFYTVVTKTVPVETVVTKKLPAKKLKKKKNTTAKGIKKTIQKEPNDLTPIPLTKNGAVNLSEEQKLAHKSIFLLKHEEEIKLQAKAKLNANSFFLSKILNTDLKLISQTLYYYFWQVIMPIKVIPVRGHDFPDPGLPEIVHILLLLILFYLSFKDLNFFYLISAHIMILPFLGIIPAPYMNLTWVSDQHLYLALPLFVAFWLRLVEKLKSKYSFILPSAFLIFFAWKCIQSVPHYRNQNAFFEASLAYNPYNIPIAYNLAVARVVNGDWKEGYEVLTKIIHLSESEPWIKENLYFPYAMTLYLKLKLVLEQNAN